MVYGPWPYIWPITIALEFHRHSYPLSALSPCSDSFLDSCSDIGPLASGVKDNPDRSGQSKVELAVCNWMVARELTYIRRYGGCVCRTSCGLV